jgi:hypothetical protein
MPLPSIFAEPMEIVDLDNSDDSLPPAPPGPRRCTKCRRKRSAQEFIKQAKQQTTNRRPLADVGNIRGGPGATAYWKVCAGCRAKAKPHNEASSQSKRQCKDLQILGANPETAASLEEIVADANDMYTPLSAFLIFRLAADDEQFERMGAIGGLYDDLPDIINPSDGKAVAQYIIDLISNKYRFNFHHQSTLTSKSFYYPSSYSGAIKYTFTCSQRDVNRTRPEPESFEKFRNTRRIQHYKCDGEISVVIPTNRATLLQLHGNGAHADAVIRMVHQGHPGRENTGGVPASVREWIQRNPRASPQRQREELLLAMSKGEIPGVEDLYLSPAHVYYWWRKMHAETLRISDDPWINLEHSLKQDPKVSFQLPF